MRGILLAGGTGSRLMPSTNAVSKHLLPVYDKPLIYYSLTNLMLTGAREILVICRPQDLSQFRALLGDGRRFGIHINYSEQSNPNGIAEALLIGSEFASGNSVAVALGDNVFHGSGLSVLFRESQSSDAGSSVLLRQVPDPKRFGIAEIDDAGNVLSIQEKPAVPKSNLAITGLYFFDGKASSMAKGLEPSARGELEMTELLEEYLSRGELTASVLPRGTMWLDAGTERSMLEASQYVASVQTYTGQLIGSPEEVAWRQGWITSEAALDISASLGSEYGTLLRQTILGSV